MMPNPGPGSRHANRQSGRSKSSRSLVAALILAAAAAGMKHSIADELAVNSTEQAAPEKKAAASPANAITAAFNKGDWPFLPLERPAVPKLKQLQAWARNPVDAFVASEVGSRRHYAQRPCR